MSTKSNRCRGKEYPKGEPKPPQVETEGKPNLRAAFRPSRSNRLGGLNHLGRFLLTLKIERRLAARFRDAKSRWASWRLDRVIRILLDAYFAGIERLYHFEDLETEPLFCARHQARRDKMSASDRRHPCVEHGG